MENLIFNINSCHRDKNTYPDPNHFDIDLPSEFKNIIYIKMTSIELPYIFYNFHEKRNNVSFTLRHTNNTIEDIVTLDNGNYTSDLLIDFITTKLDAINTDRGTNFELSLSFIDGRLTFTNDTEFTLDFTRNGDVRYEGVNNSLGYKKDSYTGTIIRGDSVLNVVGNHYALIKINDILNIYDPIVNNVFAKILLDTDKYNIYYEGNEKFVSKCKQFRKPQNFSKLCIKAVDQNGELLDLGCHNFSMTIELGYIYDLKLYQQIHNNGIPDGDPRLKFLYNNR